MSATLERTPSCFCCLSKDGLRDNDPGLRRRPCPIHGAPRPRHPRHDAGETEAGPC